MKPSSPCPESAGYTLVELMVAMLIMAVLAAGITIPLSAQVQMRRTDETRRILDESRDALLGFAAAHGRLPCPATLASRGEERFAPAGSPENGACETFHGGYLPGATLGLGTLDPEGFTRDAWGTPANRIRYAVHGGVALGGVTNPLTRVNGMQSATLAGLAAAPHYLFICIDGAQVQGTGCGPATNQLTRRAAIVLISPGLNAGETPIPGSDEARNLDGDAVFVSHEASNVPGREFDDVVQWVTINLVINRMVTAGRLP